MSEFEDFDGDFDRFDEDYDDYPFAEMMENEDFAQDGDFHNMEYNEDFGCWSN